MSESELLAQIKQCLYTIYKDSPEEGQWEALWNAFNLRWELEKNKNEKKSILDEKLCVLISYGDSIVQNDVPSLQVLNRFLSTECENLIQAVHILPFFPYSSDDGFSVSDYRMVRKDLGTWEDISSTTKQAILMCDLVLNHCSQKHDWFQKFLASQPPYDSFFITADPQQDFSQVVRPRPHFVLSEYTTKKGTENVWTTFSKDQVDLNFANPQVLFEILDVLLYYVIDHGSRIIRLDAIAYLWKELGTTCIHHPKTHLVVQLMRKVLDLFAPGSILITETNVPHEENIRYFGKGDEAQLVYNFPLPPLLLYSCVFGTTRILQEWAQKLVLPCEGTSFFNFCASHDGIGVTPTHGILSEQERNALIEKVEERGGKVSYKASGDTKIPYELNISYVSAMADPQASDTERVSSFLATQSVLLTMPGVPAIYIHSLLGSQNWSEGLEKHGYNRAINREKLDYKQLVSELSEVESVRAKIFSAYLRMISVRSTYRAFHPLAAYEFLPVEDGLFAILRSSEKEKILCVVNLGKREIVQRFQPELLPFENGLSDILEEELVFLPRTEHGFELALDPYEFYWLATTR